MAKNSVFYCTSCGYETGSWMGRCPGCGEWNTLEEASKAKGKPSRNSKITSVTKTMSKKLKEIETDESKRVDSGISELNRVLGGGLVPGSVTLLGGDPGIGKSTILLQICNKLAEEGTVLYVSGEESFSQLKMRAERIGIDTDKLYILSETDMNNIETEIERVFPKIIIVDSIQTIYRPELTSATGTVSQVKEAAASFTYIAKTTGAIVLLIGHVTKEGTIAGPRVLEHIVDTVLYFEGDRYESYRILRTVKNRFGSTNEIGVFEMKENGFQEVMNPSSLFLSDETSKEPGVGVTCIMEGTRPVMVEIQALVSETTFGNPRRTSAGIDYNRLSLLAAVIEKKGGIKLGNQDVYLNVVGGLKIEDRSCDALVVLVIASSLRNKPLLKSLACIGEVSLTGELRSVSNMDKRISECIKLGYDKIIVPRVSLKNIRDHEGAEIIPARNINEAIAASCQ